MSINGELVYLTMDAFSILGVVVFAISGALYAAEKKMDILGFILIGTVTGLGGGTLKDLLLGVSPVSWVTNPGNIYLCVAAASITYFSVNMFHSRQRWILWMDAIGLAAFAVMGARSALVADVSPLIAVVMGVMTATFGGIMRDVLCAQVLTLMRPEIYVTAALLGSFTYTACVFFNMTDTLAVIVSFLVAFCLRGAAIAFQLTLPNRHFESSRD